MQHDYVNMSEYLHKIQPNCENLLYVNIRNNYPDMRLIHAYLSNSFIDMNNLHVDTTISHVDI